MQKNLHKGKSFFFLCFIVLCIAGTKIGYSQTQTCTFDLNEDGTPETVTLKQRMVAANINTKFKSYIEYVPSGYDPLDISTRYPVIIYFAGLAGIGSAGQSCKMFNDKGLPFRIEQGQIPASVNVLGDSTHFIVISAQYNTYNYPTNYPSADQVDSVINFVIANYNVDSTKIYLTGMSSGANMVIEYASSSISRAHRVAAIITSSLCSTIGVEPNSPTAFETIANAELPYYAVACENDQNCDSSISTQWVDSINTINPTQASLALLFGCAGTGHHDSWSTAYDSSSKIFAGNNIYNWSIQFSANAALPVNLKEYNVKLLDGKVQINWTTTSEINNGSFTIERAGPDHIFNQLATIPGSGNSSIEKNYSFTDDKPLSDLSFYRLVQTDIDGKRTVFGVKKIMNRTDTHVRLLVSPNPFKSDVSAFLKINRAQRVNIFLTDMSGRRINTQSANYTEGTVEIKLNTANIPNGIYLLKIQAEDFSEIQKLVKQ